MKKGGYNSKNQRLGWIDYARGIAIIFVVSRHAIYGFYSSNINFHNIIFEVQELVYNLRMPLFFILSGIFVEKSLKRRGLANFIKYKANSIIYPYFIWGCIQVIIQVISSNFTNSNRSILDLFLLLYNPRAVDQFWFLYTLFAIVCIFGLARSVFNISNEILITTGFLLYFISFHLGPVLFGVVDIFFYFIFLAIGAMLSKIIQSDDINDHLSSIRTTLYLLPIIITSQYYWCINHKGLRSFTDLYGIDTFLFLPISIIGALFIFSISFFLNKNNLMKMLQYIGRHSLYIYVMHVIVMGTTRAVAIKLFGDYIYSDKLIASLCLIFIIFCGIFLPIVLYSVSIKINLSFLYRPPNAQKTQH